MARETTIVRTLKIDLPAADAINHPTTIFLRETFTEVIIEINSGGDSELVCATIPYEERKALETFLWAVRDGLGAPEEEEKV